MNIENLRAFTIVAKTLNFRRAAEKLFLSQPALSQQIAELEKELGAQLFTRTTRCVRLTAAGEACLDGAAGIVQLWDNLHIRAGQAGRSEKTLRIGVYGARSVHYISRAIERFKKAYPEIELDITRDEADRMYEQLLYGEIDILCSIAPGLWGNPRIEKFLLVEEYPSVLLPQTHPLADKAQIAPKELKGERIITHSKKKSLKMYERLLALLRDGGAEPNVVAVEDNDRTGGMKVLMGEGIGLYPSKWTDIPPGTVMIPIKCDNRPFARVAAWRKGSRSGLVARFLDILEKEGVPTVITGD